MEWQGLRSVLSGRPSVRADVSAGFGPLSPDYPAVAKRAGEEGSGKRCRERAFCGLEVADLRWRVSGVSGRALLSREGPFGVQPGNPVSGLQSFPVS